MKRLSTLLGDESYDDWLEVWCKRRDMLREINGRAGTACCRANLKRMARRLSRQSGHE